MNAFSGSECIRFGWETFKKRPWFFIGVEALVFVISGTSGQLSGHLDNASYVSPPLLLIGIVGLAAGLCIGILVKMGLITLYLKAHDNPAAARAEDLWAPAYLLSFVFAWIALVAIVLIGLVLLVVPGIIWGLRYMFAFYFVKDRGLDAITALSESARITYGHKWELFGFVILLGLLNILGFVCILVGLLVTIPVSSLAVVHAYRTLSRTAPAA